MKLEKLEEAYPKAAVELFGLRTRPGWASNQW